MPLGTILISILIACLVLLLFLVGLVILKTFLFSPAQKSPTAKTLADIDGQSVAERLGLAVQFKTISYEDPEKFDSNAFLGLHRLLQTLYPQVHAKLNREVIAPYSLLYTWEGTNPDLKPIMLISHLDVVPADESEETEWTYPPFSGKVADGFVWGRGTLDIKCGVIGVLEAVEHLLKDGFQPERTVYLAFGHDEEVGGPNGASAVAQLLLERGVSVGSLLDEGGGVIEGFLPGVETPVGVVGISEKGYVSLRLTVEVDGGHSSMPASETAIGILSKAVARLEAQPMPAHLEVVEFLMGYLGSALPFFQRMLFANTWLFGGLLKKKLAKSHLLNASMRTTTAPTIIHAGVKDNVLPGKAEAVVNFRILPGDDLRSVYEMVLARINDQRVEVTPYQGDTLEGKSGWDPSPVADTGSPYFLRLTRLIREVYPGAMTAPYLVLGGTDARHYASVTQNAFRFSPMQITSDDLKRMHGVDERLSIENCAKMVGFYMAYIEEMANLPSDVDSAEEDVAEEDGGEEDAPEENAPEKGEAE
jgi:carboxypeptidase PM20D1